MFRKKTHTNVLLNSTAVVPTYWKTGIIKCLLSNARKICTSEVLFKSEVDKLRMMFAANGYPRAFFNNTLEKFLTSQERVEVDDLDEVEETDRRHIFGVP